MRDSIYLGHGDTIQRPQQGTGDRASTTESTADPDRAAHEAIIHRQWQQYAAALVADGELAPEQAKPYGRKMAEADIIRKLSGRNSEQAHDTTGAPWRRAQGIAADESETPSRWLEPQ